MRILNDDIVFASAPRNVVEAFRCPGEKRLLGQGIKLFKFSSILPRDERVSPWWLPHAPLCSEDTGYAGQQNRARRLSVTQNLFTRARNAVTQEWNAMDRLVIVVLNEPVWGFYGVTGPQRKAAHLENVVWIGGAYQLWIPNLTSKQITTLA